jgi:hypothetical protein
MVGVALASIAATTAFILSCGQGPKTASAQTCAKWEFSYLEPNPAVATNCANYPLYPDTCQIPAGWDIVGDSQGQVLMRRCAP